MKTGSLYPALIAVKTPFILVILGPCLRTLHARKDISPR